MKSSATKFKSSRASMMHYKEMQSQVQKLNCYRAAMSRQPVQGVDIGNQGIGGGGGGGGSDSKALAENSAEDFALAPVLGLDRRKIAATGFVYGTIDQFFHQALTLLHSLQRLRRRKMLAQSGSGLPAAPDESDEGPSTPRSSAFTWDLVEPMDGLVNEDDDWGDGNLAEIAEDVEANPANMGGDETFEDLSSKFKEAVENLEALGSSDSEKRAKRLKARFALIAYDVDESDRRTEIFSDLGKMCKVKHNHKPPAVPGGSAVTGAPDGKVLKPNLSEAEYCFDRQLRQHVEKCKRDAPKHREKWSLTDECAACFWRPLTQLGRAKLFSHLLQQLVSCKSDLASAMKEGSAASSGGEHQSRRGSPSRSWEDHEGIAAQRESSEESESDPDVASTPRSAASDEGARPPPPDATDTWLSVDQLVAVLARGLEFVTCPEQHNSVVSFFQLLIPVVRGDKTKLQGFLSSESMQSWLPRLSSNEREILAGEAPILWSLPQFLASELRIAAPPPPPGANAEELLQWADTVSAIVGRSTLPDSIDQPLMSEVQIYALHHALQARERAAWLQRCAHNQRDVSESKVPILHSRSTPVTVAWEHIDAYIAVWRPGSSNSSSFVPPDPLVVGKGKGKTGPRPARQMIRNGRPFEAAAELVWDKRGAPTAPRFAAVSPDDDEALVQRLVHAGISAGKFSDLSSARLNQEWANRIRAEATFCSSGSEEGPAPADLQAYAKAKGNLVQLTERIDVQFEACNTQLFEAGRPVQVLVRAKNCGSLAARVFEVDAWRYYMQHGRDVPSDISLEGLEPNAEIVLAELQQLPPLQQVFLNLDLPFVERGGVYVLELIGNGVSCRALLHIGAIHLVELERGLAGHVLAVYNSSWDKLEDAVAFVDGVEYETNSGELVVPHVTGHGAGQWTKVVVRSGTLCGLFDMMRYSASQCDLRGGFFVDDEQMLEGNPLVKAICRAQLFVNEERVPLTNLQNVVLQTSWKRGDSDSFQLGEQHDITLTDGEDHISMIEVPRGARSLKLDIIATAVKGREVKLQSQAFTVHGVAEERITDDLHLCAGFELQALGRSGEPVPGRVVDLSIKTALSRDFLGPFRCQTDESGRIVLGKLAGVVLLKASFTARGAKSATTREWALQQSHHSWCKQSENQSVPFVQCVEGDVIVPVPDHSVFVLEEVQLEGQTVVSDLTHLVSAQRGALRIAGLPAGRLCRLRYFHPDGSCTTRVLLSAGKLTSDMRFAVVNGCLLEWRPEDTPPRLEVVEISDIPGDSVNVMRNVQLRVANATPGARVHLVGRRFWRPLGLAIAAASMPIRLPSRLFPARLSETSYLRTRRVGDVVRYVFERRPLVQCADFTAPSLPTAETAPFPGVCVHGTPVGETMWDVHGDAAGEKVEARHQQARQRPAPMLVYPPGKPASFATANVAFTEPSTVLSNLPISSDGFVDVQLPSDDHAFYEILVAQPNGHASIILTVPEHVKPRNRDTRLMSEVLDPSRHYGEIHGSRVLSCGQTFELRTPSVSQMQVYDRLPQVFDALLALLNRSKDFQKFEYLKRWPTLEESTKVEHYSRDACHELHLFLFSHDRPFFDRVVAPLIANRRRYSRLDRWLLQLPPQAEVAIELLRSNRIEQLLYTADLKDSTHRTMQLQTLLRLIEEDAAEEARKLSLERRSQGYNVVLRPHAEKLAVKDKCSARSQENATWNVQNANRGAPRGLLQRRAQQRVVRGRAANLQRCNSFDAGEQLQRNPSCDSFDGYADEWGGEARSRKRVSSCFNSEGSVESCSSDEAPPSLMRGRFAANQSGDAWFCRPAQRVVEREWISTSGPRTGGSALWCALARGLLEKPSLRWPEGFVSSAVLETGLHGGISEALIALALLDLPFAPAAPPSISSDEGGQVKRVTMESGPAIVFFSMVQEVEAPAESSPLLITQELRSLGGNKLPRASELLVNTVIEAQVLVVNCGADPRELRLLLQCPEGAIPVGRGSFYTRSADVAVPSFGSKSLSNYFYFPHPGNFRWFPAHALEEERLVAFEAASTPLQVVTSRGAVDAESWRDVAARGSLEDVVAFLRRPRDSPISEAELSCIAWRMRDSSMFSRIISELRSQMRFSHNLWGYGFLHKNVDAVREYLAMANKFRTMVGPRMESSLLITDSHDGSIYSHYDFEGLVLSRAHTVGVRRQNIEDADVRNAYKMFLTELAYTMTLSLEDRIMLTSFMLHQDRVDEARIAFEPVKDVLIPRLGSKGLLSPGPLQLQAAYHMAYLDLVDGGDLAHAKLVVKTFADVGWLTTAWKTRFAALGKALSAAEPAWEPATAEAAADQSEGGAVDVDGAALEIEEVDPQGHRIQLRQKELKPGSVQLSCYVVDVELTFSASPFTGSAEGGTSHVTAIAPTISVSVEDMSGCEWVTLPEAVRRRQMVLEVVATAAKGGRRLSASRPCYFCDAKVSFDSRAGTLQVQEGGRPTPGAYVKVFAGKPSGQAKFYKDGYTDCLGAFNYVSLNAKKSLLGSGSKLAVLVLTRQSGALVREVPVPPLVRRGEAEQARSNEVGAWKEPAPCSWPSDTDGEGEEEECRSIQSFRHSDEEYGEEQGYGDEF